MPQDMLQKFSCGRVCKNVRLFAYAIGVAEPVSIFIDTYNTHTIPVEEKRIKTFDLPGGYY